MSTLKELRNCSRKLILCPPQKQAERQHSKLLFFKINLHFGTSDKVFTYGKLNFPPVNSICLIFAYLEMQKRLIQTKAYYNLFYSV